MKLLNYLQCASLNQVVQRVLTNKSNDSRAAAAAFRPENINIFNTNFVSGFCSF